MSKEAPSADQRTAGEPETAETAARQPEVSAACPATRSRRQIDGGALTRWSKDEVLAISRGAAVDMRRLARPTGAQAIDDLAARYERLYAAAHQACSEMGCYCADDNELPENLKCPMCRLEKAMNS